MARERGWSMVELSRRTGISLRALYYLRDGRQPATETLQALRATFPEVPYDELFVTSDCTIAQTPGTIAQAAA